MNRIKGILYAAVSSSTFGLAPFFSITLLLAGFSAFEVLSYRWGVAAIVLTLFGWCSGCNFRLAKKDLLVVFLLSLLRATTSFSLLIAYQNIATGVASTIHFMYPLAVSLAMMFFFHEKKNVVASVLVKGDKQPLKLRHLFFRDNQHSSTLRNQVVIRKNHGSTFVAVGENLGLHAVKA